MEHITFWPTLMMLIYWVKHKETYSKYIEVLLVTVKKVFKSKYRED